MNFVETRLRAQQLIRQKFKEPSEVVAHMGAIQAQEYRLMRWAVGMRTRKPSLKAFEDSFNRGEIVRLHLLRGTWQLITRDDYQWMMSLFALRARKVIDGWMSANGISISMEEYDEVASVLKRVAGELRSATKEDFATAVAAEFGPMDDHRLSYHIRHAELTGLLCSGDLLPMKASYSLVSEKLGVSGTFSVASDNITRTQMLKTLARKYFQGRGPATLTDFVWWSGLSVSDCKKGMEALGTSIQRVFRPGDPREFFILDTCETALRSSRSSLLLPPYDEYLIGYKSRDLALAPEHVSRAHNNSGNFSPIVVSDGQVCGNWRPFSESLEVDLFSCDTSRDIEPARTSFRSFLSR